MSSQAHKADKVSHASLNGLYVKAQELDRGQNEADAPTFAPPGVGRGDAQTHASDAEAHASSHASDAGAHASSGSGGSSAASTPATVRRAGSVPRPPRPQTVLPDAETHASGFDAQTHAS